ncbi:asparagine synthase-related protein [Planctomycetota bacterium]
MALSHGGCIFSVVSEIHRHTRTRRVTTCFAVCRSSGTILTTMWNKRCSPAMESRYGQPFVDRRLFEWALSVPPYRFGENGRVKAPLRRALASLLPPAILRRSDKGNYIYYWDLGVRKKERPRILELLEDPISAELGFVEPRRLERAYDRYCRGGEIDRRQFWSWLTLEQWLRRIHQKA